MIRIIKDYMENNDGTTKIEIREANIIDLCDPMRTTVYEGRLKDIPEELWEVAVYETGWSIGHQCYVLTISDLWRREKND